MQNRAFTQQQAHVHKTIEVPPIYLICNLHVIVKKNPHTITHINFT